MGQKEKFEFRSFVPGFISLTQKELDILFEDNEVASDAEQEDHEIEVAESEEQIDEEGDIQSEFTQIRDKFIAAGGTKWLFVPPVESQRRPLNVMHPKVVNTLNALAASISSMDLLAISDVVKNLIQNELPSNFKTDSEDISKSVKTLTQEFENYKHNPEYNKQFIVQIQTELCHFKTEKSNLKSEIIDLQA
ncbi:hypothetical protein FQR65_LT09957 [Abscondita terminalis]|nr:hypothetical protein FQR65_LT09957 [Abscondita terminalis]